MAYKKSDVDFHSDGHGRPGNPAVNVKCHGMNYSGKVQDRFKCSEAVAEKALEFAWNSACSQFWEQVQEQADHHLGAGLKVYSEGRSSGWAVVHGLPPVDSWDAVRLGKWRAFEAALKREVAYQTGWEQIRESIKANRWAEENAEEYNYLDRGGETVCLADVKRCAHCAGRV